MVPLFAHGAANVEWGPFVRSSIQSNIDTELSGSVHQESPLDHGEAGRAIQTRSNVLPFPDEIDPPGREAGVPAAESTSHLATTSTAAAGRALRGSMRMRLASLAHTALLGRPEVTGCVALIAIFAALIGIRSVELIGIRDCRADPVALALGLNIEAAMTVRGGTACALWVKGSTASITDLEITSPPRHGVVLTRGRTGVVYQPERQFTGRDSFAFTLRGTSPADAGTSIARVNVNVR
jgi:hypothetical protein